MSNLSPERIAAIQSRATEARRWIAADPCNTNGWLPLSVRTLLDHDIADLIGALANARAEVERLAKPTANQPATTATDLVCDACRRLPCQCPGRKGAATNPGCGGAPR